MKNVFVALLALSTSAPLLAQDDAAPSRMERLRQAVVRSCLNKFVDHPFDAETVKAKFVAPTVSVLGQGSVLEDLDESAEPALIIIAPAVNVLGNATYKLMNPNGWYCLSSNVSVLGSTSVELDCDAHFAQSSVVVLAKSQIRRIGACETPPAAE